MQSRGTTTIDTAKRIGTGLSQVGGPLLLAIGFGIHPADKATGADQLQVIADNLVRWNVAHILILLGTVLFTPATLGLASRLERRGAWFGSIGAALVWVGAVFLGALVGAEAFAPSAMVAASGTNPPALAAGLQAILDMQGAMPVVLLGLGLQIGLLVQAAGLFVTQAVPRWQSLLIAVGAVLLLAFNSAQILVVGSVVTLIGLGAIGVRTIRDTRVAEVDAVAAAPQMQLAHS
jgi:hypothetical protein